MTLEESKEIRELDVVIINKDDLVRGIKRGQHSTILLCFGDGYFQVEAHNDTLTPSYIGEIDFSCIDLK